MIRFCQAISSSGSASVYSVNVYLYLYLYFSIFIRIYRYLHKTNDAWQRRTNEKILLGNLFIWFSQQDTALRPSHTIAPHFPQTWKKFKAWKNFGIFREFVLAKNSNISLPSTSPRHGKSSRLFSFFIFCLHFPGTWKNFGILQNKFFGKSLNKPDTEKLWNYEILIYLNFPRHGTTLKFTRWNC